MTSASSSSFALTTDLSQSGSTIRPNIITEDLSGMVEQVSGVTHQLHLAPRWIGQLAQGARESLQGLLLGWQESMRAVPLQLHSLKLSEETGRLINENPCVHVTVKAKWSVFRPREGAILRGVVRQQTPEHVSLLLLGYFNATIPANQMGYRWDGLRGAWCLPHNGEALLCGASLEFVVLEVRRDGPLITIIGSIDKLEKLAADKLNDKKRPISEQDVKKHGEGGKKQREEGRPIDAKVDGDKGAKKQKEEGKKQRDEPKSEKKHTKAEKDKKRKKDKN